jgi:ubiquinol-cytochrome c reductase cytochrome c1 subunit
MTAEEYDVFARDLAHFLEYTAEPSKLDRQAMGYWVIGFLFIFLIFAYLLKVE